MRHGVGYRKFQKSMAHTRAMFRNIATSLILHESIETTVEKAKELRPIVERLIGKARTDSVPARRTAYSFLQDKKAVHKLFTDVAPRFKTRNGGFTRVIRTRLRAGDRAQLAVISLVDFTVRERKVAADAAPTEEKKSKEA